MTQRDMTYAVLMERVRWMKTSEEKPIYDDRLLDMGIRASALTDLVCAGLMTDGEARTTLETYIDTLRQKNGETIRF